MPTLRLSTVLSAFLAMALSYQVATAQSTAGAPSTVVASQGGASITLDDVDAFASRIPENQRAGFFRSPTRIENMLTSLLLQRQLAVDARKIGLDKDPSAIKQVQLADEETLARIRIEHHRTELKVPDFAPLAQEDYIAHKEKYVVAAGITVQNVLVSSKDRSEADAKAIADKVEIEARAHPEQFDALVEKYSDDPDKATGKGRVEGAGDAKKYAPEFAAASSALKNVGDISPVIKTTHGFHVIKLVERKAARTRPFAEVKAEIVARLGNEYIEKEMRTYTDTLRNLPLDANADLVASLRTRFGAAPESTDAANAAQP